MLKFHLPDLVALSEHLAGDSDVRLRLSPYDKCRGIAWLLKEDARNGVGKCRAVFILSVQRPIAPLAPRLGPRAAIGEESSVPLMLPCPGRPVPVLGLRQGDRRQGRPAAHHRCDRVPGLVVGGDPALATGLAHVNDSTVAADKR